VDFTLKGQHPKQLITRIALSTVTILKIDRQVQHNYY